MANISYFTGYLGIPDDAIGRCSEELISYIDNYQSPYYGVMDWNIYEQDIRNDIEAGKPISIGFSGGGRWSAFSMFENDGRTFFYVDGNPEAEKLLEKLDGCYLPIAYVDEEEANGVLYDYMGHIHIHNGEVTFEGDYCDYEYTERNLCTLFDECECLYSINEYEELVRDIASELDYSSLNNRLRESVEKHLQSKRCDGYLTEAYYDYFIDCVEDDMG